MYTLYKFHFLNGISEINQLFDDILIIWPAPVNYGYLLFFETTIMGNTADLAMVQKTIIDTLHKEGKSQRVITERGGCSRSAVSKHIKFKVDWKEEFG